MNGDFGFGDWKCVLCVLRGLVLRAAWVVVETTLAGAMVMD